MFIVYFVKDNNGIMILFFKKCLFIRDIYLSFCGRDYMVFGICFKNVYSKKVWWIYEIRLIKCRLLLKLDDKIVRVYYIFLILCVEEF